MQNALVVDLARENIGSLLDGTSDVSLRSTDSDRALRKEVGRGEVRFGYWGEYRKDPLPDFLIVRDDELTDTNAWLSAFLPGLAPISQWCRVMSGATAIRLADRAGNVADELTVGPWVGAILAEASLNFGRHSGVRDASGLVALSGATYAAARGAYIWGHAAPLGEICGRLEELGRRLGQGGRPYELRRFASLWGLLAKLEGSTKVNSDSEILAPFKEVAKRVPSDGLSTESIRELARMVASYFGVPEIEMCAVGPQSSRVSFVDAVARRMVTGPRSVAIDAVLGFSASLVDPGVAILPDLLKRYSGNAPLAPIWTGAFAGMWSPMRVLSENFGLGRLIVKELTKPSDLYSKPSADISYEELIKWIGSNGESRPRIRGLSLNYINVEVVEGVTIPVSYGSEHGRSDSRNTTSSASEQRTLDFKKTEESSVRQAIDSSSRRVNPQLSMDDILKRVENLEAMVSAITVKSSRAGSRSTKK